MLEGIREACDTVHAVAAGKSEAEIRRMLTAEFQSRGVSLPPPLFELAVSRIAAGTYVPGEPVVNVRYGGLLRVPFIRNALRDVFGAAIKEHGWAGVFKPGVMRVSEHVGDSWPTTSWTLPHPPDRGLYAPEPDQVPPPARLIPDPDLRDRIPELFEPPPPPPTFPGMPSPDEVKGEADLVFVWLEDSGGAIAVCTEPGRIGVLEAEDAEAYLPLIQIAHAQDQVVAATADFRKPAYDFLPVRVRVIPNRNLTAGTASPGG
jgi:hypothetical protein